MQDLLKAFLESLIHPERLEVILDCVATLENMDYEAALDELNQVIMIADSNADSNELVARVEDIIRSAQDQILQTYEVQVDDSAMMYQRQAIVKTVTLLPYYVLPDDINNVLMSGLDNEETLASIVPFFEYIGIEELVPLIVEVSDAYIHTLTEFINTKLMVSGVPEDITRPVERISDVNRCISILGYQNVRLVVELANSGVRVGRPLNDLIQISFSALDALNLEQVAYELIGLTWFSDTPKEAIWHTVDGLIDSYTDNPLERTMMQNIIQQSKRFMGVTPNEA